MRSLTTFAALGAALLLGGCGFTPMYAAGGVSPALGRIQVEAPESRTGFLLREELDDAFGRQIGEAPAYVLALALREDRYARGLRLDDVATRYEVSLRVDYILTEAATRRQLKTGSVQANATYDVADQPYAGVASHADGQERAATQAAERIKLDIGRWFALQGRTAPGVVAPPGVPTVPPGGPDSPSEPRTGSSG